MTRRSSRSHSRAHLAGNVAERQDDDRPRYSVLLPTHNRADVIGFAIASVLAQTEPSFELLVVGDGCTDNTAEVVTAFADRRIRWFDLPKAPHFGYANRNIALRQARGELIAFMAHDDLVVPDHLSLLGECFDDPRVEWAYSRPVWVSDEGVLVPFAVDLRQPDQLKVFLDDQNTIPASCVVYRRTCHERYGYWREDLPRGGDWAYWRAILRPSRGTNLAYVSQPTALHFRANWKTGKTWGPPPLPLWLEAANDGWWPAGLRVDVSPEELPQAAVAAAIARDPTAWSSAMRASVPELMEQLAWNDGVELSRLRSLLGPDPAARLAALEKRLADAEGRRAAEEQLATLASELRLAVDALRGLVASQGDEPERPFAREAPPPPHGPVRVRLRGITGRLKMQRREH